MITTTPASAAWPPRCGRTAPTDLSGQTVAAPGCHRRAATGRPSALDDGRGYAMASAHRVHAGSIALRGRCAGLCSPVLPAWRCPSSLEQCLNNRVIVDRPGLTTAFRRHRIVIDRIVAAHRDGITERRYSFSEFRADFPVRDGARGDSGCCRYPFEVSPTEATCWGLTAVATRSPARPMWTVGNADRKPCQLILPTAARSDASGMPALEDSSAHRTRPPITCGHPRKCFGNPKRTAPFAVYLPRTSPPLYGCPVHRG